MSVEVGTAFVLVLFPSCTLRQILEQDNISNQFVKLLAEHMSEGFKQTQTERCVVYCVLYVRAIHMAPSAGSLCFPPTADSHMHPPCGTGARLESGLIGESTLPWGALSQGHRCGACPQGTRGTESPASLGLCQLPDKPFAGAEESVA